MPANVMGCIYPTNYELYQLQPELMARYMEGRVGLEILPLRTVNSAEIVLQKPDIFKGLQGWRGLDQPTRVVSPHNPYGQICRIPAGYWGEHDRISEEFLTVAAQPGSCNSAIDLTEHMTLLANRLLERRLNRIEFNIWQALVFGQYVAYNESGQIVYRNEFNIKQLAVGTPWSSYATATPMADIRGLALLGRGSSSKFGAGATLWMNQVTANCAFANTNPNDIGRVGLSACCNFMGQEQVNQQFLAQNLPQIGIYDETWTDDNGGIHPYIPDGKVVAIGTRPGGAKPGSYYLTRNAVGCDVDSGPWQKIVDSCDREVPRTIQLYDGHNGGVGIEYPSQIIVLDTGCTNDSEIIVP